MKTYYIYHIPDFVQPDGSIGKIGCSDQPKQRVQDQNYDSFEILEEHSDIYVASDREIELQIQYDYPVDKVPYWMSVENRAKGRDILKGRPISQSHRESIAESNKRRTGQSASESRLEALRASMQSDEVRNKISANRKGKGTQPKSEETKRKIAEAKKLYWQKKKGLLD